MGVKGGDGNQEAREHVQGEGECVESLCET
jgi:hypothetical protein